MDSLENKDLQAAENVQAEDAVNEVETTVSAEEIAEAPQATEEAPQAETPAEEETEAPQAEEEAPQAEESAEETPAAEACAEAEAEAAPKEEKSAMPSKEELVEQFKELLSGEVSDIKEQAEQLKTQFYRIYRQEQEAARKAWEEAEEKAEEYKPVADEIEQNFRQLLNIYKEQRAEAAAKREAELQQNLLRKENIIEQMKAMSESEGADVMDNLQKMRDLREEWKGIGAVPATETTRLWKEYNLCQERFYDLVKINNELREYDFKKNLEQKTQLCEQAEALQTKEDVVEAFRQLQQLHDEWANIGPVAREVREEIWNRFKEASTVINKRHQDYFERLHALEESNRQKKQAIIDQLKEISTEGLNTNKLWDEATEKITTLQAEWRTIGFAPKKVNQQIYEEYRALCDKFFTAKTDFYKQLREELNRNLQKKRALLRHAEELKDSTEWKETTEKMVKLQKEWKETGAVARKYSDELWKQFSAACDHFFAQKKEANKDVISQEKENLKQKKAILQEIEALEITTKDETLKKLRELMGKYQQIGFVPFREKEKLYRQYREATDKIFDQLQVEAHNRRFAAFTEEVEQKDENALMQDRRRLMRQYEALQQDIKTAENNILFFSSANKKGNKLVEDMQRRINEQKMQLKDLEARINLIDSKLD